MKTPITKVSDHAVVRYMVRVLLVDVDGLRRRIGRVTDNAVKQGASSVTVGGMRYLLRGDTMTTVMPVKRCRKGRGKK